MASLYKRATPSQRRLLRIVEGAIKNACDAHPGQYVPQKFARSIAKRAAGTISAQWPGLLAARPSARAEGESLSIASAVVSSSTKQTKRGEVLFVRSLAPRAFKMIYTRVGLMAGWARKAGHEARAAAMADALRAVSTIEAELKVVRE